jgi:hypothetical protein
VLISVLFSTFPLTAEVARQLHRSAYDLYRSDAGVAAIDGDSGVILSGEMRDLKQDVAIGTYAGPTFEARVETERGPGVVRFFITRQGIEMMTERDARTLN